METRLSRRRLLKAGASAALAAGGVPGIIIPGRASAQQKTLRILKWVYPIATYDDWFIEKYSKEWGRAERYAGTSRPGWPR
jgi:hypothetical protein